MFPQAVGLKCKDMETLSHSEQQDRRFHSLCQVGSLLD
jgi:hypothetical protein